MQGNINHLHTCIFFALLALCLLISAGCIGPNQTEGATLVRSADMVPAVIVLEYGDQTEILKVPENRSAYRGPSEEILTVWSDGILRKRENLLAWLDLNRDTGMYDPNPGVDLTSWDTPIAVDSERGIIYAFAHTVAPNREIMAHYISGMPTVQAGQLVADEIEMLSPLPSNGWPAFYVDRPGQATALTVDDSPTRKMRVYGGQYVGGEFPDVLDVFFLENCVVMNREKDGWMLFESGFNAVSQRTMSLGEIPGVIRPLSRIGDLMLIASDEVSEDGETVVSSALYSYAPYTRAVELVWDSGLSGEPVRILALAANSEIDFYVLTADSGSPKKIYLLHFVGGEVTDIAEITTPEDFGRVTLYLLPDPGQDVEIPEAGEAVDLSAGDTEELMGSPE